MYGCNQSSALKIPADVNLKQHKNLQTDLVQISQLKKLILPGDIITRTGNDFTSQSLKTLNRKDKTFSHCGIASLENDSLFVYHALGGEWNPDQKIKRELFDLFCSPLNNNMVGVYRFKLLQLQKNRLLQQAKLFYKSNILFDLDFDLKTDDKMYCTEFVYKSILKATDSLLTINHSFIKEFEFIGVDDIIHNSLCSKIAVLNYRLY